MPSRASYLLRVGGRLKGDLKVNGAIVEVIRKFFENRPSQGAGSRSAKPGASWPDGFALKDYHVCAWDFKDEEEGQETLISFRAEAHHLQKGTLYGNKAKMVPDVEWFYHSPEYQWHRDLKRTLQDWNRMIGEGNLIERIWFREWQWYCGNGGGD